MINSMPLCAIRFH